MVHTPSALHTKHGALCLPDLQFFVMSLLHQLVARHLPAVQVLNTDTTLEEAAILGATSCKFAHFIK